MYLHVLDVNWDTVDSLCDVTVEADLQIKVYLRGAQHTLQTSVTLAGTPSQQLG
jgi:hypothetical protein